MRVSRPEISSTSTAPAKYYYWHPATGQLSWTSPEGQDALKSLQMTRYIITDAVERLQNAAAVNTELSTQVPIATRKAIQASALLNLLVSLSKEQLGSNPLDQMGTHASRVWCTVHACIAAAVAEIGAPAPVGPLENRGAVEDKISKLDVIDGGKAIKTGAGCGVVADKSDDDMDIEEEKDKGHIEPDSVQKKASVQAASDEILNLPPTLAGGKFTKKTTIKPFSKVSRSKRASAMISKWASVQKELKEENQSDLCEEDFDGDEAALAAFLERKRSKQAEEWRTEQIRSGAVDKNPNFAPVMGDWRNKVKKPRVNEGEIQEEEEEEEEEIREEKADDGVDAAGNGSIQEKDHPLVPAPFDAAVPDVPDVDALSVGLPPKWKAIYDASSCGVYYGNIETQVTQWERPSSSSS